MTKNTKPHNLIQCLKYCVVLNPSLVLKAILFYEIGRFDKVYLLPQKVAAEKPESEPEKAE